MKETKIYCDHCGKELDTMKDYTDLDIDLCAYVVHCDLCKNCISKLNLEIAVFTHQHKNTQEINNG